MDGLLSRDAVLNADDLQTAYVTVPEWGGNVKLRSLTGEERDYFEDAMLREGKGKTRTHNLGNFRAKLCAMCCVTESGERMFTDADVTALGRKSGAALGRVANVAIKLNGMNDDEVEELVKNSEGDQNADSPSA